MIKKEFLKEKKCKICDLEFNENNDNVNYCKFFNHIKKEHNINLEKYFSKYYLNDKEILCACGCGNKTKFIKGKFLKYYSDHKNKMKPSQETIYKIEKIKKKYNSIENLIKKSNLNFEILNDAYNKFINFEKPISELSRELFIDFRTLQSYWEKLGLIENKEQYKRNCLISQTKWFSNPIIPNDKIISILKENLFLLKLELTKKDKMTFNEIENLFGVNVNKLFLSSFLKENLNSDEIKKIKFIKTSQIEMDFFNVLKFYFNKSITHSFILENKIFDYKLGDKILIELDGEYWHSKEDAIKNDLLKNEIAKRNNFILIRVNDKHVKKLEFINKLKKIYENVKKI